MNAITRGAPPEVLFIRSKASLVAGLVTCVIGINSAVVVNICEMVGMRTPYSGCYYTYDKW